MKKFMMLLGTLGLLGCATAEIKTPPVQIVPNDRAGAVGVDVYARARSRGNPVPRFRGQETVQVRTWHKGSELSGVPCTLDSGVYKASFRSPANIVVPDYGPNSPAVFVRCESSTASGSVTVNAFNQTLQQRQNQAVGTGVRGAIIIGAVAASKTDSAKDDFAYPAITVTLKDKG